LFPAGSMPVDDVDAIGVRMSELSLRRPRQWGACWLALQLWQQLELDNFWRPRFARAQGNTPWLKVLKTLVAYRLIDPGSEWRLHRQCFDASAMADLLDSDFALAEKNTLYRCLDRIVEHKDDLFKFQSCPPGLLRIGLVGREQARPVTKQLTGGSSDCCPRSSAVRVDPETSIRASIRQPRADIAHHGLPEATRRGTIDRGFEIAMLSRLRCRARRASGRAYGRIVDVVYRAGVGESR
jgi:hypothetical protein